jgi:hypothetical protein
LERIPLIERKRIFFYGKDEPLPERLELRAGPLSMIFEAGDLRTIRYEDKEIIRRVYMAVRDRNWGTVTPVLTNLKKEIKEDSFLISYQCTNRQDDIHFTWTGVILGDRDGTITFKMEGEAKSTFLRNRIGFCVLHPAAWAGVLCKIEHVDGSESRAELPLHIVSEQPVQPFCEMRGISHQIKPGWWAEVKFNGEVFEMEDQRNWTDASFKTFGTPLRLPYPVEVKEGTHISQSVRLCTSGDLKNKRKSKSVCTPARQALTLSIQSGAVPLPLPPLGLGCASHGQLLNRRELELLQALHLDHLRVDLPLECAKIEQTLDRAVQEARRLGLHLDIALIIPDDSEKQLRDLARKVVDMKAPVRTWLVFPSQENYLGGSPTARLVELARKHLDGLIPRARFAAGTNTDFIFLQRNPPPVERVDLVTFSINPQVHAFDNASLVETLEAQAQAVCSARNLCAGLPIMVSPVTLKMRFNPYATGKVPDDQPGELPPQVDVRQMSLFGAGWTLGSLSSLAQSGAARLTYFETTGWRGVMETKDGPPLPEIFRSNPGNVYPMYFVFAAIGEFAGGEIIPSISSHPQVFSGLALRKGSRQRILLANHTPDRQMVMVPALGKKAVIHQLDETNVEEAMRQPEEYRQAAREMMVARMGIFTFELYPYAFTWLDF